MPLRRVNQAYVIATSTRIDITSVDVSAVNDALFAKKEEKKAKTTGFIEAPKAAKTPISAERKDAQKKVDAALNTVIAKTENLEAYLNAKFTLTKNTLAHSIKF